MPTGPVVARAGAEGGPVPPSVQLSVLAATVPGAQLGGDALVQGIAYDSRRVQPGSLFFAMPGTRTDGHAHAEAAVASGACALVVERPLELAVPQLIVRSVRAAIGPLAAAYYGRPSDRLAVVGVTGTNGKTTVCSLLRRCLDSAGVPAGQIGTVGSHFLGRALPTSLTTPQAPDLQWTLWQMAQAGVQVVGMEASSHGLDQGRLSGISFDIGIFTNLSREHLDYHGTMEHYWEAKAALFDPDRCRFALIGVDDDWGRRLAGQVQVPVVTFGQDRRADVGVTVEQHGLDGITVELSGFDGGVRLHSRLVGSVNGMNLAAAYLATRRLGTDPDLCIAGIAACDPPPGRFELVDAGQPFLVVVDYAHTPDALAALIVTARQLATGVVTVVVGARGGRDPGKRPITGRVAAAADRVFLTTDSPGDEPIGGIIDALYRGALEADGDATVVVEPDRRRAIEMAVEASGPGDVVLIVGRGHETVQHIGGETVALDDRLAAHDALVAQSGRPLDAVPSDQCA
jgi:UDP-N-acetylmuramoyl-L-alanyl-D-glutamate--2,6-diaminopimelate ligase